MSGKFTLVPLLVLLAAGCGGDHPTRAGDPMQARRLPEALREEAGQVVRGNTAFALDLYRRLAPEREGNLFLSPFSISTAFAMVQAGARGRTADQIASVFRFPAGGDRLHPVFAALLRSLDTGASFGGYRLSIANRLWGDEGFTFLPAYLDVTRESYGAELETLDFSGNPEAAREVVNDWVAAHTGDRIRDLMPEGSIDELTRLVLTNAIYFKGNWAAAFDPERTRDEDFHVGPGHAVTVSMMHQKEKFLSARLDGVSILALPYAGQDLSMILILPDAVDGLAEVEKRLTPETLGTWMGALQPREIDVSLPRFETTSEFSLNQVLAAMGMPDAFDSYAADFSGMDGQRDLVIQAAVHKAFVKVNEEGTEAAGATGISVGVTSLGPGFAADHPFLFLIHDNVTGSVLFLGRIVDPTAAGTG